jgi:hypothetical protein
MNYIGNFKEWVTPELMEHLRTHDGDLAYVWQPDRWSGHPLLEEYRELARPVYSNSSPVFHQFNGKSQDMSNFPITLPSFPETRSNCHFWFVKLNPGELQAMHIDPHLVEVRNPVRYSMFLEDYQLGHIFVYDDKIVTDYKAGDVFEWSDPMIVHGVVNTSRNVRYTLQVTMHD